MRSTLLVLSWPSFRTELYKTIILLLKKDTNICQLCPGSLYCIFCTKLVFYFLLPVRLKVFVLEYVCISLLYLFQMAKLKGGAEMQ